MGRSIQIGLTAKSRALKKLIEDAETLKFNPKLIKEYRKQLLKVEMEIKKRREERKRFKEVENGG